MISKKVKIIVFVLILIPVLLMATKNILKLQIKQDDSNDQNNNSYKTLNQNIYYDSLFVDKNIILFIDFEDFSCIQCENQVLHICKWVEENLDSVVNDNILLFVKKRNNNELYYKFLIGNWIRENKVSFQVKLDGKNIFNKLSVSKTSIAILDRNNGIIYFNSFPLAPIQLEEVKKIIKNNLSNLLG